jgi:hypothetical protein
MDGTWRSLVARFLGVEEVAGSNPVVPIRLQTQDERSKRETSSVLADAAKTSVSFLKLRSWALSFLR